MHELKKYPNRRLYDSTESRYVTVDDVRTLIINGESIHVVDAKDGEDITRSVLLQVLSEQEVGGQQSVLTNRVIEQLIRFYGDQMGSVVGRYIEQSIVAFMEHQDQWRAHLRQLNQMNPLNLVRQTFDANWMSPSRQGRQMQSEASDEADDRDDQSGQAAKGSRKPGESS